MAAICYYGNVMTTTRWRLYVTMVTLWQQQDGGYMLLWKRYDNKMAAICYYGNVMSTTRWRLCVFYIFNSTVIDWTCYMFYSNSNRNWKQRFARHHAPQPALWASNSNVNNSKLLSAVLKHTYQSIQLMMWTKQWNIAERLYQLLLQ